MLTQEKITLSQKELELKISTETNKNIDAKIAGFDQIILSLNELQADSKSLNELQADSKKFNTIIEQINKKYKTLFNTDLFCKIDQYFIEEQEKKNKITGKIIEIMNKITDKISDKQENLIGIYQTIYNNI